MSAHSIAAGIVVVVLAVGAAAFAQLWIQARHVPHAKRYLVFSAVASLAFGICAILFLLDGQVWQPVIFAIALVLQLCAARLRVVGTKKIRWLIRRTRCASVPGMEGIGQGTASEVLPRGIRLRVVAAQC